ncbi:hypothetical protein ZIOFF_010067 [Zingiber officinale]|uniref:VQ domain-containing protein n=1 Tax=Zingiber officinale TaxID=94328 RepID=A0A8J5HZ04_ZINOF|nr:hypothetical protein ZIOFF_010067 [Zingiber officinale]
MDPSDLRPSPRQEMHLKGPRPSPLSLKVSKDSHTIRKPLAAPPPPHRDPVIIYSVSPKVIHADPSEFMALVQKLTGPDSAISPAARIASFEKSSPPADLEPALFPGILSPMPAELPPISPNIFSPSASDPIFSLGLSPDFADENPNANWGSNLLTSPNYIPSPGAFWELLHQCPGICHNAKEEAAAADWNRPWSLRAASLPLTLPSSWPGITRSSIWHGNAYMDDDDILIRPRARCGSRRFESQNRTVRLLDQAARDFGFTH